MINKKHFSFFENCKPMRVWLWFVCKITENYCHLRLFSEFIQNSEIVSYFSWQNTYSNLKTTCHIKLKYFLWTKPLQNLSLAKYLMLVTATLIISIWKGKREREKKKEFLTEWKISKWKADIWSLFKSSWLLLDVRRLSFTNQIIKKT